MEFGMNREKERNSSYELLKIISMFLTVLYHIILHEKVLENCKNEGLKFFWIYSIRYFGTRKIFYYFLYIFHLLNSEEKYYHLRNIHLKYFV